MPAPAMAVLSLSAGLDQAKVFAKRNRVFSLGLKQLLDNTNGAGQARFRSRFPQLPNLHVATTAHDGSTVAGITLAEPNRFHSDVRRRYFSDRKQ